MLIDLDETDLGVIQQGLDALVRAHGLDAAQAAHTINSRIVEVVQAARRKAVADEIRDGLKVAAKARREAKAAKDAT